MLSLFFLGSLQVASKFQCGSSSSSSSSSSTICVLRSTPSVLAARCEVQHCRACLLRRIAGEFWATYDYLLYTTAYLGMYFVQWLQPVATRREARVDSRRSDTGGRMRGFFFRGAGLTQGADSLKPWCGNASFLLLALSYNGSSASRSADAARRYEVRTYSYGLSQ